MAAHYVLSSKEDSRSTTDPESILSDVEELPIWNAAFHIGFVGHEAQKRKGGALI